MTTSEPERPGASTGDDVAPDSAMDTGSDAGEPGESRDRGSLGTDEERLLGDLTRDAGAPASGAPASGAPEDSDAAARAAADDAPLPGEGGDQGDGLSAVFSAPEAE